MLGSVVAGVLSAGYLFPAEAKCDDWTKIGVAKGYFEMRGMTYISQQSPRIIAGACRQSENCQRFIANTCNE